jgi:2-oxoglutarate dehydrogenase E1 component
MSATQKSTMLTLLNTNNTNHAVEPMRRHLSRLVLISKKPSTPQHRCRRELVTTTQQPNKAAATATAPNENEKSSNFLNGSSAVYVDEIYQSWLADPKSVHKSWDIYFRTNSVQVPPTLGQGSVAAAGPQLAVQDLNQLVKLLQQQVQTGPSRYSSPSLVPSTPEDKLVEDHLKLYALIRSYQIRGHKKANLDPLGIGRLEITKHKKSIF